MILLTLSVSDAPPLLPPPRGPAAARTEAAREAGVVTAAGAAEVVAEAAVGVAAGPGVVVDFSVALFKLAINLNRCCHVGIAAIGEMPLSAAEDDFDDDGRGGTPIGGVFHIRG